MGGAHTLSCERELTSSSYLPCCLSYETQHALRRQNVSATARAKPGLPLSVPTSTGSDNAGSMGVNPYDKTNSVGPSFSSPTPCTPVNCLVKAGLSSTGLPKSSTTIRGSVVLVDTGGLDCGAETRRGSVLGGTGGEVASVIPNPTLRLFFLRRKLICALNDLF